MTRRRYDQHSTEFGLWLRERKEIDSKLGYVATNIDYMWHNHKKGKWLYLEEKRFRKPIEFPQKKLFEIVDHVSKNDPNYCGFHTLIFERTNPEDGKMWLDNKEITKDQLMGFLKFESE